MPAGSNSMKNCYVWYVEIRALYTRIYKGDEKLIFAEGGGLVRIEKLGLMQKVNFGY